MFFFKLLIIFTNVLTKIEVTLDIEYTKEGITTTESITLELFDEECPKTVENFIHFLPKYKGSTFHRIINNFMIQGGDFVKGNGTGTVCKWGETFEDENFAKKHAIGSISMANRGPHTNGCQFYISTAKNSHLNNHHVVFGKLKDSKSEEVVRSIQEVETDNKDKPIHNVTIKNYHLNLDKKNEL